MQDRLNRTLSNVRHIAESYKHYGLDCNEAIKKILLTLDKHKEIEMELALDKHMELNK